MTTTAKKSNKVSFRVANSIIEIGKKYVLDHKEDPSAPEGVKDFKKYPFSNNTVVERVFFDSKRRQFDTCFYEESPSLAALIPNKEEAKSLVALYKKHIKAPYEEKFNANLEPNESNSFWEDLKIEFYVNKQYDTTDANDLLELFLLLYMGAVCEKNEKNSLLTKDAAFVITSSEGVKNKAKNNIKKQTTAFLVFHNLLEGDRDKLNLILQWIDRDDPSKIEAEDLEQIYYQVINNKETGLQFSERFLEAESQYETDSGKEVMEWFYAIRRLYNLRHIKRTGRGYVISETEQIIGNTLQDAAKFCLNDTRPEHNAIVELIQKYPDIKREVPEHIKPKVI